MAGNGGASAAKVEAATSRRGAKKRSFMEEVAKDHISSRPPATLKK
jgi:hypothetical protein